MVPSFKVSRISGLGAVLLAGLTAASASVVFDNPLNVQAGFAAQISREHGDEIALAGSDRFVTTLTFQYTGDFPPTAKPGAMVRIYANDGRSALPGSNTARRPGTLLWELPLQGLLPGHHELTLSPKVFVPDTITWTVEFAGLSGVEGDRAAVALAHPPTVGALLPGAVGSFDDYWVQMNPGDADSWALRQVDGGNTPANFRVQVLAMSAPPRVAVFDDPAFMDTFFGSTTANSKNLQASLTQLGYHVTTFKLPDLVSIAASHNVLFFPTLSFDAPFLASALSEDQRSALSNAVAGGSQMIVNGSFSRQSVNLINTVFGLSLTLSDEQSSGLNRPSHPRTPAAARTQFAGCPDTLRNQYYTTWLSIRSLPLGAHPVYAVADSASVALIPFGQGNIVYLGWNWDWSFGNIDRDGGWMDVLDRATLGSAPPGPIPPGISWVSESRTVPEGTTLTLRFGAWGSTPLENQWFLDGVALPGETNAALVLTEINRAQAGVYSVVVSNEGGATPPATATISVLPRGPGINNGSFETGDFSGWTLTPDPSIFYDPREGWQVVADSNSPIPVPDGTFATTIEFPVPGNEFGGRIYQLGQELRVEPNATRLVFNYGGSSMPVPDPNYFPGEPTVFRVVVEPVVVGGPVLAVTNFVATHESLRRDTGPVRNAVSLADFEGTRVRISFEALLQRDFCSAVVEGVFQLDNVLLKEDRLPPEILQEPVSRTAAIHGTTTFAVKAFGGGPLTYQWYFEGRELEGANEETLTLNHLALDQAGSYWVTVSNSHGATATSARVTLEVAPLTGDVFQVAGLFASNSRVAEYAYRNEWYPDASLCEDSPAPRILPRRQPMFSDSTGNSRWMISSPLRCLPIFRKSQKPSSLTSQRKRPTS